jgi:hypothetical protein
MTPVFVMPAKAGIQYSPSPEFQMEADGYWIIRLRG